MANSLVNRCLDENTNVGSYEYYPFFSRFGPALRLYKTVPCGFVSSGRYGLRVFSRHLYFLHIVPGRHCHKSIKSLMQRRLNDSFRLKPCDHCSKLVTVRFRIQYDQSQQWFLVCKNCQLKQSANNSHYRYGGTWKAKKRKR